MATINTFRLEAQIKAIRKNIEAGKCKNIFAAQNKVKSLTKQLYQIREQLNWNNYLSQ